LNFILIILLVRQQSLAFAVGVAAGQVGWENCGTRENGENGEQVPCGQTASRSFDHFAYH